MQVDKVDNTWPKRVGGVDVKIARSELEVLRCIKVILANGPGEGAFQRLHG